MKLNKWTVGLAAVGAISLSSAVQAEEMEMNMVDTAVSGTTLSGYINTSFSWNFNTAISGDHRADAMGGFKGNGFNLDAVNLTVSKALGESEWAAGYKFEAIYGPDAQYLGTSLTADGNYIAATTGFSSPTLGSDFGIKQAYVEVRTPVGNGIDWKFGVFDTIIGYESFNANNDPNYTRSLGWGIEPTQHTGLLASYQINDIVSVAAGVAETVNASIGNRPIYTGDGTGANPSFTKDQWNLTYMGAVSVTAPEDMGALAGSSLYGGIIYGRTGGSGYNTALGIVGGVGGNQTSYYVGATFATPVEGLSFGTAFDYLDYQETSTGGVGSGSTWVVGLYTSYQATEKLSLHGRGEYQRGNSGFDAMPLDDTPANHWEGTLTAQYDLWENVISRLEFRWDNMNYTMGFAGYGDAQQGPDLSNAYSIMLNMIYVF
jgi:hypothetical protein